ncbi:MAG: pitrilysin family protein [Bacteroidota bacterium]
MLNRANQPKAFTPGFKPYTLPDKIELNKYLTLYSFNQGDQQVFKIELLFSSGAINSDNPVLSSFCVSILREGSLKRSASEINDLIDYYGAFLDLKSGIDSTSISLYGRSEYLHELIAILQEVVLQPIFPDKMISKHKERLKQKLKINNKKTSYWAPRLLRQSIFGKVNNYGKLVSEEDIDKLRRDELVEYHKNVLLPSLQKIILAGSYNNEKAINLIKAKFSSINGNNNLVETISQPKFRPSIIQKNLEGTTQASLALGKPIFSIDNPTYPEIGFLIKVLGGYFGSRLMKKLREDKGLTYGIHAFNIHLKGGSYLQISADVESSSTDKSIELIFKEFETLKNEPVLIEELETVKNYMLGEYINDSNSVFDFTELHKKILLYELTDSFYESFYSAISRIDSKTLIQHANSILNQDDFSIVKVL